MFKKVHKTACVIPCTSKDSQQCSKCNSFSTKTTIYVCESGHVVCKECQSAGEVIESRQGHGDYIAANYGAEQSNKINNHHSNTACDQVKDLAGGDHVKRNRTKKIKRKSKSEYKIKTHYDNKDQDTNKKLYKDNNKQKQDLETIVEYKNTDYSDSKSTVFSSVAIPFESSNGDGKNNNLLSIFKVCPRPVLCPVVDCGKMIATDSTMLHFYFDHSKIPRVKLSNGTAGQIYIKLSNITTKTQCLTVFLTQDRKESPLSNQTLASNVLQNDHSNTPLLLMAVRIQTENLKVIDQKSKTICTRNISTQTGLGLNGTHEKITKVTGRTKEITHDGPWITNDRFDTNEVLLLWLCRIDDTVNIYSITLLGTDEKLGHSYIGDIIHIKENQEPRTMYHTAKCLLVHGLAANRLLDKQNQILTIINILE